MKTRSIFFHFVLLLGICWVPASFAQIKPEDNDLQNLRSSNKSRKELIQGMRKRLQNFQGKMKSMGMNAEPIQSPTSRKNALPQKRFSSEFTYGSTAQSTNAVVKPESHTDNNESLHLPTWHENKSGFYFLPFVGFSYASNVDYHSSIGPVELQRKNGYNTGYRLGYDFGNLFLEQKAHYFSNQIEGGNLPSYEFSGDTSGLSMLIGAGLKIPFSEYMKWVLAGSVGGTTQDFSMSVNQSIDVTDSKLIMSFMFSTGIEFRPFEHILLSIHYNWYHNQETSYFSDQSIHAFEFSLGYFD